jgi:hypothetical protein
MFKALDKWLLPYMLSPRPVRVSGPFHIVLCVCDHWEPFHAADRAEALRRVAEWEAEFPRVTEGFRDADGRPPAHTFFFPVEQWDEEVIRRLHAFCHTHHAEVEVHLHHKDDTAENLRDTLLRGRDRLAEAGFLAKDAAGSLRYAFVHGDWALDNSYPGGGYCGVSNELDILRETGCYGDFTLPSAPNPSQTRTINSIYYATDTPAPKSHDRGRKATVGTSPNDRELLLVQGPLGLNWRWRKWGLLPRIENAEVAGANPPTLLRVLTWLDLAPRIVGAPHVVFVKLHTHGGNPRDMRTLLGDPMRRFHQLLAERFNDGTRHILHYVTARELANIVHGLETGGSHPGQLRDTTYQSLLD